MGYDTFGLKIGVEGEKEFKNALRDINQSFKVLGSEMKLVSSEFDKQDKSVAAVAAKNEVLNKAIDAQKDKIKTLEDALRNASESFGENDKRTQNWAIQLNNAKAELNGMERELSDNEKALDDMGKEEDDAAKSADELGDELKDTGNEAEKSGGKFEKLGGRTQRHRRGNGRGGCRRRSRRNQTRQRSHSGLRRLRAACRRRGHPFRGRLTDRAKLRRERV